MSSSVSFERDPSSARQARRFVTDQLDGHDSALVDDVVLMVSELVTNSILHSTGGLTLTVEVAARIIRVAVTDAGPGRPSIRSPKPEEPNGRGLALIAKLADEWGASANHDGGNTVWFSVDVDQHSLRHHSNEEADLQRSSADTHTGSDITPQEPPNGSPDHQPPPAKALWLPLAARGEGVSRRRCAVASGARATKRCVRRLTAAQHAGSC